MKRFRLSLVASVFCFALAPAFAQETVDWKSLGKPLDDDTKAMVDRYVYFNDTTTDKAVGLNKPVLSPPDISEWISQRVAETLTLTPQDYDAKTVTNKRFFTPKGYGEYIATLNAAQLPDVVKKKRFKLSSVILEPPNITDKGVREETAKTDKGEVKRNIYIWQLDVPVVLGYNGVSLTDNKSYKVLLKTELVRIPMQEDRNLIAINSWRLEEYKPPIAIQSLSKANPDPGAEDGYPSR